MRTESDQSWQEKLRCPYCGSRLDQVHDAVDPTGNHFGILRCDCRQYPIVTDIPILASGRIAGPGVTADSICHAILDGRLEDALVALLRPHIPQVGIRSGIARRLLPGPVLRRLAGQARERARTRWDQVARALLIEQHEPIRARRLFELYFGPLGQNTQNPQDYFVYRFGQPRQLTALGLASILDPSHGPVLDLGCGPGHITRYLCHRYKDGQVVGIDNNFFLLFLARKMIAPEASYVCCNADIGLPFIADSFAAVNCVNTFHFLEQKVNIVNEMQRATLTDGLFLISALRHSLVRVDTPNTALPPSGYARLWHGWQHKTLSDESILQSYLLKKSPDLRLLAIEPDLDSIPIISMVISQSQQYFQDSQPFADWPHALGRLHLNPLYERVSEAVDGAVFKRRFPSKFYADENREMQDYLPEEVTLASSTISDLARAFLNFIA